MPYLIRRPRIRRTLNAFVGAALLTVAIPAVANACTLDTSAAPQCFKSLGDPANYTLVPERLIRRRHVRLVADRRCDRCRQRVVSRPRAGDSHSLSINPTGVAVSPPICVGVATPTFRFVARRASGTGRR